MLHANARWFRNDMYSACRAMGLSVKLNKAPFVASDTWGILEMFAFVHVLVK